MIEQRDSYVSHMPDPRTEDRPMPSVSALTAARNPNGQYMEELHESLHHQDVDLQWVIQIDGSELDALQIPRCIKQDNRVEIDANGEQQGTAATRMIGLLRCDHERIQNTDADDIFLPKGMRLLADAIEPEGIAFAFGRAPWLLPDNTVEEKPPSPYEPGIIEPGVIADAWLASGHHNVTLSAIMWKSCT